MPRSTPSAPSDSPPKPWTFTLGDGLNGLLDHGSVDHVIIDPPYGQAVEDGNAAIEVRDNAFGFNAMTEELRNRTARAIATACRRWALIFCDHEESHLWRFALIACGMTYWRTGIWVRLNTAPQFNGVGPGQGFEDIIIAHARGPTMRWNGGGKPAIWHAPIVRTDRVHPTQKPASLMRELVNDFTDEGELIADCFAGSCSTGVAALGLSRRFVGWEANEEHYRNGLKRMELPLFDRPQSQLSLDMGQSQKGAAARAKMEIDIKVLTALEAVGQDGVLAQSLVELVDGTPAQINRSLRRLEKAGAIHRTGRTRHTKWFKSPLPQESHHGQC